MTWLKKDVEILAYVVRIGEDKQEESEFSDYCKNCFKHVPEDSIISEYVTKENFAQRKDQKLLCDRCGKEITP